MSKLMFRSEVEKGKLLASVDIIPEVYQALSQSDSTCKVYTTCSGIDVLALKCSQDDTSKFVNGVVNGEFDLVPSENNLRFLDFSFMVNKAAVELFQSLGDEAKVIENKHIKTPLIITGSGVGGYLAILLTLRLHHAIDMEESIGTKNTKRPLCITFGTPLVGDAVLQRAIAERPQWRSSFLNVVAINDQFASFFSSKTAYKPLGTSLFCTESGGHAAFEDQDSILQVLDFLKSSNTGNLHTSDYKNVLSYMRRKVLYRGVSKLAEPNNLDPLRAGITLQLEEVGVSGDIIGEIEKKHRDKINKKNVKDAYEPTKKLNDSKIWMAYMEWYKKSKEKTGGNYYNSYKTPKTRDDIKSQQEIATHQRRLNQYWKRVVKENNLMPQKEGAKLRKRWLYAGTNYRKMVEPLDIAEFYKNEDNKKSKISYIKNRPEHYTLLETWSAEEKKSSKSNEVKRNKLASLTEDSCFWAHVEDALILLTKIQNAESSDIEMELEKFEAYVICAIKDYMVSSDVFLEGSSLRDWWDNYKAYKGSGYTSEFTKYI